MSVVFAIVVMWFNTTLSQLNVNMKRKLLFWWKLGWIIWKDKAFIDKGELREKKKWYSIRYDEEVKSFKGLKGFWTYIVSQVF